MGTEDIGAAVRELARAAVAVVAPGELPTFTATAQAFARDPDRVLKGRRRSDRVLDSGLGAVVTLVTPAALSVATIVYQQLVSDLTDSTLGRGRAGLRRVRERLRSGRADRADHADRTSRTSQTAGPAHIAPYADQRSRVAAAREEAVRRGRELGLPDETASALADAVIDALSGEDRDGRG